MAYNQEIADRIREKIQNLDGIEEKEMMGGLSFMLNKKMCLGVIKDEMICRIDPAEYESALEKQGCSEMVFTGRPMKGWVMVDKLAMRTEKEMEYWVNMAVSFNKYAKQSKKRKS